MISESREHLLDRLTSYVRDAAQTETPATVPDILEKFPVLQTDEALAEEAKSLVTMQSWLSGSENQSDRDQAGLPVSDSLSGGPGAGRPALLGKTWGNFILLEELGRGGFGQVFKAWQLDKDRCVALKRLHRWLQADAGALRRFRDEPQHLLQLSHENIIQVWDVGEHDTQPYFVMELVDGTNLSVFCRSQALGTDRIADIVASVARALHFAHQHGILHRDVKPSNVLLTRDLNPKIGDFGLAKDLKDDQSFTRTHAILGTFSYLAPELASGESEASSRSDIYGLGAILYELLTGKPPFRGESPERTLAILQTEEVVPPRQVNPDADSRLEAICLKCLEKRPDRRYESAEEVAVECDRVLAGKRQQAPTHTWLRRTWKAARRRPGVAASVISATVMVVLAIGVAIGFAEARAATLEVGFANARAELARNAAKLANNEAELANERARFATLEETAARAKAAVGAGHWYKARALFTRAIEAGHSDPYHLRMEVLRCVLASGHVHEAETELAELAEDPDLPDDLAGSVALYQGDLLLGVDNRRALELIEQAIDKGHLQPADSAFANALVAETVLSSVQHLRIALDRDPTHLSAREALIGCLFLANRWDEALTETRVGKALFPNHADFQLIEPVALAGHGDAAGLETAIRRLGQSMDSDKVGVAQDVARLIADLQNEDVAEWKTSGKPVALARLTGYLTRFAGLFLTHGTEQGPSIRFIWPPKAQASIERIVRAQLNPLTWLRPAAKQESLIEAASVVPQGIIYYLVGEIHLRKAEWIEAEAAYKKATEMPSLIRVRTQALFRLSQTQKQISVSVGGVDARQYRQQAAETLRQVLKEDSRSFTQNEFRDMADTTDAASDFELMLEVVRVWRLVYPNDVNSYLYEGVAQLKAEAFVQAEHSFQTAKDLGYRGPIADRYLEDVRKLLEQRERPEETPQTETAEKPKE